MLNVSSIASKMRRTIIPNIAPVDSTQTEIRRDNMLMILDGAINKFNHNLEKGLVPLRSTLDLERLVKLTLLLSGEADSRTGVEPTTVEEIEQVTTVEELSFVREMIQNNDPVLIQLREKLMKFQNEKNDV